MPDELFDLVDANNVVIGQAPRSVVHQRGLWHRGVHVFLFTREGKLLVQQRSQNRDTFPSALDCSVSEHVQAGENFFDAAVRGLKEELGIDGIALRPIIEFAMNYGPNDNEISRLYEGVVEPAVVRFDPAEVERIDYYSWQELDALMSQGIAFSRWFAQLLKWRLGAPHELKILKVF